MSSTTPTKPRPSASLIVINRKNEVLLVHRNPKSKSFAGAHVFPGGNVDPQDSSIRMTAIRETFEETGILLGTNTSVKESVLDEARKAIHSGKLKFEDFLSRYSITPDINSLLPFTQWVTPPSVPRRFHTHFFVTFVQRSAEVEREQRLPTPDGGLEVISTQFIRPQAALQEFKAKNISLMPPQYYLLTTLAELLKEDVNTEDERRLLGRIATGPFGNMVINPRQLPQPDENGHRVLTYEGDETRGGGSGKRHRCLVIFDKGGVASEITLVRNIDVYEDTFKAQSKL